jgi:hypothetical protein
MPGIPHRQVNPSSRPEQTLDLRAPAVILPTMAKGPPVPCDPPTGTVKQAATTARLAREAAALRANLHKRKEQARALDGDRSKPT